MKNNMLVVARKYNDIFYAISTEEWKMSSKHILLIISLHEDTSDYPLQQLFDEVYSIHSGKGCINYIKTISSIKSILRKLEYNIVTISNVALMTSELILSYKKTKKVILLEDGLMNYYSFTPSRRLSKRIIERLLGIKYNNSINKITKTYLLNAEKAMYFYGTPQNITLDTTLICNNLKLNANIKGSSIFVGQDIYNCTDISIEEYSEIVNKIIKEYNIDYYLPHRRASENEKIYCKVLLLEDSSATMEVYASCFDFNIYSFSSSVLYTSRFLNPRVNTYLIKSEKANWVGITDFLRESVTEIIEL